MDHEAPIDLKDTSWEESRGLIGHELTRLAAGHHRQRNSMQASYSSLEVELARLEVLVNTNTVRTSVLEAKAWLFGLVAGAVAGPLMTWLITRLH